MPAILVSFLLFFLPFLVLPFGVSPFEGPKVFTAEIFIALLFIVLFLKEGKSLFEPIAKAGKIKHIPKPYLILTLLIFLTIIDLIFFKTSITFFGNPFRLQGIFLLWNLIIFSFLSTKTDCKFSGKIPLLSSGLLLILTPILGANETGRAIGTLGEPNALASVAIFVWPCIFFSSSTTRSNQRIKEIYSIAFIMLILAFSGSRSAAIAFLLQSIFIFFTIKKHFEVGKVLGIMLVILALTFVLPFLDVRGGFESRADVWQTALHSGITHPILGGGFGNTELLLKQSAKELSNNLRYQYVDSSHNIFLDWFVQGGTIGLFSLLVLLYYTFQRFIKINDIKKIVLLLGIITVMSFNPVSVCTLIAFWWLIGKSLLQENH